MGPLSRTAAKLGPKGYQRQVGEKPVTVGCLLLYVHDEMMLNVPGCRLTYWGQVQTNAEAWFNKSLRPRKPEGSLGRTAQDGHLDSHTAPELC